MKYNEAIDMILDGGRARRLGQNEQIIWYEFHSGALLAIMDGEIRTALLYKDCFTKEDWIVEKDGVVYEEYPARETREILSEKHRKSLMELIGSLESGEIKPEDLGIKNKNRLIMMLDRIHDKDEPAELEDDPEKGLYNACKDIPWPKVPILFDGGLDEGWLEKKMLCFMRRWQTYLRQSSGGIEYAMHKQCTYSECPCNKTST